MRVPISLPTPPVLDDTVQPLATAVQTMWSLLSQALNMPDKGTTVLRPTELLATGQTYFDTTLGIPIWWNGTVWINAAGAPV